MRRRRTGLRLSLSLSPISISISIRVGDFVFLYLGLPTFPFAFGFRASTYAPSFSNYPSNDRLRVVFLVRICLYLFAFYSFYLIFSPLLFLTVHSPILAKQKQKQNFTFTFWSSELWFRSRASIWNGTRYFVLYHLPFVELWFLSRAFNLIWNGTQGYFVHYHRPFVHISGIFFLKFLVAWNISKPKTCRRNRSTWLSFFSFGKGQQ